MKRILLILAMVFLLSGCGNREISGEVVSFINEGPYVQLIVQTDEHEQTKVLADGHTFVYSFCGIEEGLLSGKLIRPVITAYELRRQDGGWLAERICVESIELPDKYILSDGTELTVRQNYSHTIYYTEDDMELLREETPVGPDNVHVGGIPSLLELPEAAQEKILSHYEELGFLYDLEEELEMVYERYLAADCQEAFQPVMVSQHISPTAANERLIWYGIHVTLPVEDGLHHQSSTYTVFDRTTGEVVDTADLFTRSEEEAGKRIIALSGVKDEQIIREMENAFRFEYLQFHGHALDVCFPAGSLPNHNTEYLLGIDYADLSGILQPWAIPEDIQ